jgi:hypothetical protein
MHCDEPSLKPKLEGQRNVEMLAHTASTAVESHGSLESLGVESLHLGYSATGRRLRRIMHV